MQESNTSAPKVFVSHASEDKTRFVEQFALRLRERGIDAWYDKWEMQPGDSLVDRIFEEGLKNATVVVCIISKVSVTKPWVREEINTSFVQKIGKLVRILPVVIDECDVPMALRSILYERIKDTSSYDKEFDRIVSSILGLDQRPPLGPLPAHSFHNASIIAGLPKIDSLILEIACEVALDAGSCHISTGPVIERAQAMDLPMDEIADALYILDQGGYIKLQKALGEKISSSLRVPGAGLELYAKARVEDYVEMPKRVAAAILNDGLKTNVEIAEAIGAHPLIVANVLINFQHADKLKLSGELSTATKVALIFPSLKRVLTSN